MKKMIFMVLAVAFSAASMAQDVVTSEDGLTVTYTKHTATSELPQTVRSGNTYIVGNQVMNRYAYGAYLAQSCPQAAAQFQSGMNLSNAGWGMFAGGLALNTIAVSMGFAHPVHNQVLPYHHAMNAMYYTGNALLTASIPVLIVGYCRQHNAANTYNALTRPQPYVSMNISGNGVGLAYNF